MADVPRVAIIGPGGIGQKHLLALLARQEIGDIALTCLCDSNPDAWEVVEDLYREAGVPGFFEDVQRVDDWQVVIASPDIDAVTVAVPNFLHRDIAVTALKTGKHLLLEKPLARTFNEGMEIHEAWTAAVEANPSLVGTMVLNNNHRPEVRKVAHLVQTDQLGEIARINVKWNRRWGVPFRGAWFCEEELSGGGPGIDLMPHLIGVALMLLGWQTPDWLAGWVWRHFTDPGLADGPYGGGPKDPTVPLTVEDSAKIVMNIPGGTVVEVEAAWAMCTPMEVMEIEVIGSRGTVVMHRDWPVNDGDDEKSVDWMKVHTYMDIDGPTDVDMVINPCGDPRNADPWMGRLKMVDHWVDCLLGRAQLSATFNEALIIQQVISNGYDSAKGGNRPVSWAALP